MKAETWSVYLASIALNIQQIKGVSQTKLNLGLCFTGLPRRL